ncbi:hypothetical protein [Microvirgula aerodenitrificans]|uniref:hypothetical protein n=1 Tax=Microvirgula aerodenitrificans TaxID=57480 RepID=UPI0028F06D05|nr:hypothetical protein [Microvirgula aerodenitrificans]
MTDAALAEVSFDCGKDFRVIAEIQFGIVVEKDGAGFQRGHVRTGRQSDCVYSDLTARVNYGFQRHFHPFPLYHQ